MKVVLFNGPPGSGKDESASFLKDYLLWRKGVKSSIISFKSRLLRITAAIYGVDVEFLKMLSNDRLKKEQPLEVLGGKSLREALMEVSEKVIKPFYGKDFFGKAAAEEVKKCPYDIVLFTDSGFEEELLPVSDLVGKENIFLVRLRGRGDFFKDSRRYLSGKYAGTTLDFQNDGELFDLHLWLEEFGDLLVKEIDCVGK